jgi:hypothetical protein
MYHHHPPFHIMTHNMMQATKILLSVVVVKLPSVAGAPTSLVLILYEVSYFISEGANPTTMS